MNLLLSSLAALLLFARVAHCRLRGDVVVSERRPRLLPLDGDRNQNTAEAEQGPSRTSESTLTPSILVVVRNRNAFCRVQGRPAPNRSSVTVRVHLISEDHDPFAPRSVLQNRVL